MRSRLLRCLPLTLLAFVAACPCDPSSPGGTPSRGVTLQTNVIDANGSIMARVYASLSETRGDPYPRTLTLALNDPVIGTPSPLAGHILHLRLLDGALQPVQEVAVLPGNANTNSILTPTVFFAANETARYDAVRALFLSGKTMVEIETDLPGRERMRLLLPVTESTGWVTNSCD